MQLYVLRVLLGNSSDSIVYALLPNKKKLQSYELVIKIKVDRIKELEFIPDGMVGIIDIKASVMIAS